MESSTKVCPDCQEVLDSTVSICPHCGYNFLNDTYGVQVINKPSTENKAPAEEPIRCPQCGSTQVEFVTYQASSNFDASSACCGWIVCGPLGLLCGQKDKTPARTVRKCKNCNHEF